jgi:hypothetical protein
MPCGKAAAAGPNAFGAISGILTLNALFYVLKSYGVAPGQDAPLTLRTNQFLRLFAIRSVREPPHLRCFLFVVPPALLTVFPPQDQPHNDAEPDGAKYERARNGNREPGNHNQPDRNNRAGTRSGH